jgi:hypothetical protein
MALRSSFRVCPPGDRVIARDRRVDVSAKSVTVRVFNDESAPSLINLLLPVVATIAYEFATRLVKCS